MDNAPLISGTRKAIAAPYGSPNRTLEVRPVAHPIVPTPGRQPRRRAARHTRGQAPIHVRRRTWDAHKRHAAALLDLLEPGWVVFYGLGSRRFFAVATWPAPHPLIVSATEVEELRDLMREAEFTYAADLPHSREWPQP